MNLIVPIAKDKPEYRNILPEPFRLNQNGIMFCIQAILGLDTKKFNNIYFVILKAHDSIFHLEELFSIQFKRLGLNASVVKLDNPTKSQPETIYQAIIQQNIKGGFFIKDADCGFTCDVIPENSIAVYPLEALSRVDPRDKSYVAVNEMYYITNIIEKKVISHYFCSGGYFFEDVENFKHHYLKIKSFSEKFYLSNIVYSMMLNKEIFRPIFVKNYVDFELTNLYL